MRGRWGKKEFSFSVSIGDLREISLLKNHTAVVNSLNPPCHKPLGDNQFASTGPCKVREISQVQSSVLRILEDFISGPPLLSSFAFELVVANRIN